MASAALKPIGQLSARLGLREKKNELITKLWPYIDYHTHWGQVFY